MRWNGQDVAEYLHELFPDDDVVAFHYRGYAPSTGSPSADALIADAPLVYDAAVEAVEAGAGHRRRLQHRHGRRRPASQPSAKLDGLILVTPFDSLKAVAQSMYPWLPIGPFFEHEIDAAGRARRASRRRSRSLRPSDDEIVPAERTDALRKRVPNLVFDRTIAGAGHNDIYARSDFHEAMHEALRPSRNCDRRAPC